MPIRYALCLMLAAGVASAQESAPVTEGPAQAAALEAWQNGRYATAREALESAAEAGDPMAQTLLGQAMATPDHRSGLALDPEAALALFDKAIAAEHAPALTAKARLLAQDLPGREPDYAQARTLAEQAAEQGDAEALTLLGDMARLGQGQEAAPEVALDFYRRAADQGAASGLREMGYAHYHGTGVPVDMALARAYLESAVAAGDRRAIPDLAWFYEGNDGVGQDLLKAYLTYRLGVERGVARAAYELGLFVAWEEYAGFWHDPVKGYGYCLLGVDWGHVLEDGDAAAECETLAEPLTEEQRSAGAAFAESLG